MNDRGDSRRQDSRQQALRLARNLAHELFQTEISALRHGRREAERQISGSPPQRALQAVAEHADVALQELPGLAERNALPISRPGQALGRLFSEARDKALDLVISAERSYRGTLLGTRHGVDVVHMLEAVAREAELEELHTWCRRWLERREPLVDAVADALEWFAQHPREARAFARSPRPS